jgi:hypothetical protein
VEVIGAGGSVLGIFLSAKALLRHLDLIEQIGVTVQHFEQLDQGQMRLNLPTIVYM